MTDAQRKEAETALLNGCPPRVPASFLETAIALELRQLEPLIDCWLAEAKEQGYAAGLRDRGKTVDEIIELGERKA